MFIVPRSLIYHRGAPKYTGPDSPKIKPWIINLDKSEQNFRRVLLQFSNKLPQLIRHSKISEMSEPLRMFLNVNFLDRIYCNEFPKLATFRIIMVQIERRKFIEDTFVLQRIEEHKSHILWGLRTSLSRLLIVYPRVLKCIQGEL